ncbi:MAG: hypothetical protein L0215_17570 [Gemmataceae bacterium]|nr:hypothetical protein [Gemmataceae bacterium]
MKHCIAVPWRRGRVALLALTALIALGAPSVARADFYGFTNISANSGANAPLVAQQLVVEVIDVGSGQVAFKFTNAVGIASSITDVYFDDGSLLGIASISSSAGVAFSTPATPGDLPGGNTITPPFVTSAGFSADSNPPAAANGVDSASEWVQITFDLQAGKTFADTIAALQLGLTNGDDPNALRIGLHVQAIGAGGQSDSFINGPPTTTAIPGPGVPVLALSGLLGLGLGRVLRRRQTPPATA